MTEKEVPNNKNEILKLINNIYIEINNINLILIDFSYKGYEIDFDYSISRKTNIFNKNNEYLDYKIRLLVKNKTSEYKNTLYCYDPDKQHLILENLLTVQEALKKLNQVS